VSCNIMLLAQLSNDAVNILLGIALGVFLLLVLFGMFMLPILLWRRHLRRRGYAGLGAYLREVPQTEAERLEAVDLTLKGVVLCVLGLLFPPLVVIGLVPLYYGLRKLAAVKLGIKGYEEENQAE
jgi:hypothetical protein